MSFIADLHIHSHFSVATSQDLKPEFLDYWARIKGIHVLGTGDFTHPGWTKELQEKLEPAEPGLFKLKTGYRIPVPFIPLDKDSERTRFLLSAEISTIYKKSGKVRKIHHVILAPDFQTVERIQHALLKFKFNITSDGRPILGMDSRDLLELTLSCSEDIFFIPAHIWTPWFSALGALSGFDSIEACYADLTPFIHSVETGLSSDPPMNWKCSILDRYTLISNSDAHSPEKLGRNANIFDTDLSYASIIHAMKTGDPDHFRGTIDFFPQEGKYHYAGHRKCGVCWDPAETILNKGICPVCQKPVTMGVLNRVAELADREDISLRPNRLPYHSLIPLKEILSEIQGVGPDSRPVVQSYQQLIQKAGSEFNILLNDPLEKIADYIYPVMVEAIRRMRTGHVLIRPGYDGTFGEIRVFGKGEAASCSQGESLFGEVGGRREEGSRKRETASGRQSAGGSRRLAVIETEKEESGMREVVMNREQQRAIEHSTGPALVIAGPGTGKTRVLTQRIAYLISYQHIDPGKILGITFTNKAANEIRERMSDLLPGKTCHGLTVQTFHQLGFTIVKEHPARTGRDLPFSVIDEEEKQFVLANAIGIDKKRVNDVSEKITRIKQEVSPINTFPDIYDYANAYQYSLRNNGLFDLDDLIYEPVMIFRNHPAILKAYQEKFQWILIDEYQDINQSQYELIRLLMPSAGSNLFAIGDPDQAIYGFRGANVRFIQQFRDDFPGAVVYSLKQSYRCSDQILQASHQVMHSNKPYISALEGIQRGVRVSIVSQPTDRSEAEFVARTIEKMMGGLRFFSIDSQVSTGVQEEGITSLSDFAVLCRIGRQMGLIEKAFADHSIPYQKIEEDPFFRQKPIRILIDLLKLAHHPSNMLLRTRLATEGELVSFSSEQISSAIQRLSAKEALMKIACAFFKHPLDPDDPGIKRLLACAHGFKDSVEEFLKFISLGTSADTHVSGTEHVSLMTLHASKGLEFKCVFIVGCEEGLLPFSLFERFQTDKEEEKRLLYVGMTRAKTYLYLTHTLTRSLMGKTYQSHRSPFLDTIEKELIQHHLSGFKRKKNNDQLSLF